MAPGAPGELAATARDVLKLAARHAASVPVSPVGLAHATTYRAAADQAAGRGNSRAWDDVAAAWERLSEPYRQAQALLHACEVALASAENRDTAGRRLRQAGGLADKLAAVPLREEITLLAKRARLDVAGGDAGTASPANLGLTERELEVLRLVAAGHSNRGIAAELFISAKTASVHVSNILAKLGVHSRGEAAAIAHQAGIMSTR